LRRSDAAFAELVELAGATCVVLPVDIGRGSALRRHPMATDLVEALAARRAARPAAGRVTVYSTVTAALLQPKRGPYAVRFDSPAAANRPGTAGIWQRPRERQVLAGAQLLLPLGNAAAALIPPEAAAVPCIVLHVPIPAVEPAAEKDVAAVIYAGYPEKRGLDIALSVWRAVSRQDEKLVIAGVGRASAEMWLRRKQIAVPANVEWTGMLKREAFLELLGRARVFVNASRHEDHGQSQLEALSAGAALATVPSPGPYEALPLARQLAPPLVSEQLGSALRAALDMTPEELAGYARRAADLLRPYRPEAVLSVMKEQVLPALGVGVT
jgi:glycosyltransferase involved in cell wall biosynthesis